MRALARSYEKPDVGFIGCRVLFDLAVDDWMIKAVPPQENAQVLSCAAPLRIEIKSSQPQFCGAGELSAIRRRLYPGHEDAAHKIGRFGEKTQYQAVPCFIRIDREI